MRLSYAIVATFAVILAVVSSTEWPQCGGLLEGEHGSFRYPVFAAAVPPAQDKNPANKESLCMWVIYVPGAGKLAIEIEELEGSDPSLMVYPDLNEIESRGRMVIHPTRLDSLTVGTTTVLAGDYVMVMIWRNKTSAVAFRWESNHVKQTVPKVPSTLSFVQSPNGTLSFQPQRWNENFVWILKDLRDPSLVQWTARAADQSYHCKTLEMDSTFSFSLYFLDSSSDDGRLVQSGVWFRFGPSERPAPEIEISSPVAISTGGGYLNRAGDPALPSGTKLKLTWSMKEDFITATTAEPEIAPTPEPLEIATHIYFGSEEGLKAYDLVTSDVTVVMEGNITGVAYDPVSKKIFPYSSGKEEIIRRANMDGSGAEIIGSINSTAYGKVAGLTVDRSTGNLYVVTADAFVLVCNTTSTSLMCAQIAHVEEAESPGSIALDPSTGRMYVKTNGPGKGKIWRGGMDGSCFLEIYPSVFFPRDGSQSKGALTFDPQSSTLYWAETYAGRILAGGTKERIWRHTIHLPWNHPRGVVVLNGRIYWTDALDKKLQSSELVFGKNLSDEDITTHHFESTQLWALTLVSTRDEYKREGGWDNVNKEIPACSHIRVLMQGGKAFRCLCPRDMQLTADKQNCIHAL